MLRSSMQKILFRRVRIGARRRNLTFAIGFTTYRHHLPFGGHECRAVAQAEFRLQGVEVDLQLAFLLNTWRLVDAPVVPEVLQLLLHGTHGLLRHTVLQPWDGTTDPFQQLERDGGGLDGEC